MGSTACLRAFSCGANATLLGMGLRSGRTGNGKSLCGMRELSAHKERGGLCLRGRVRFARLRQRSIAASTPGRASAELATLDLTEENIEAVLLEARVELLQLFDSTVGITGVAELADLDGPYVKLRLKGRFWHERSLVVARLGNYLQKRIPEIMEVDIEDVSQLDDSAENF